MKEPSRDRRKFSVGERKRRARTIYSLVSFFVDDFQTSGRNNSLLYIYAIDMLYMILFSFGSLRKVGRISEIFPIFARHLVRAPLFDLRKSNEIIFGFRPFRNSAIIKFVIFFHCVVNEKKVSIFCSLFI